MTLRNTLFCTKLWMNTNFRRIEVFILEKLLVLNSFGVVCV